MSDGQDFYLFEPDDHEGTYSLMRAALQFLTDKYWKQLGEEEIYVLLFKGKIEENFHVALSYGLSGLENVQRRYPKDTQLQKIRPILEAGQSKLGEPENILISLLYGSDMQWLQHHLADSYSMEIYDAMLESLDRLLETHEPDLVKDILASYQKYSDHVEGLAEAYDEKLKVFDETHGAQNHPVRRMKDLLDNQTHKLERLWILGVIQQEDWA